MIQVRSVVNPYVLDHSVDHILKNIYIVWTKIAYSRDHQKKYHRRFCCTYACYEFWLLLWFSLLILPMPHGDLFLFQKCVCCKNFFARHLFQIQVSVFQLQTTENELKHFFSAYGMVRDCKIILDRAGLSKRYARCCILMR